MCVLMWLCVHVCVGVCALCVCALCVCLCEFVCLITSPLNPILCMCVWVFV